MSLVAVSNVATKMTGNIDTSKTVSKNSDGFDQALKKSISTQNNQQKKGLDSTQNEQQQKCLDSTQSEQQQKRLDSTQNKQKESTNVTSEDSKGVKDASNATENTSAKKKEEKTKEVDSTLIATQINQEQTKLNDVKEIEEEAIKEIANSLGITKDNLLNMMKTLKLSFADLLTPKGIQELVNNSYGLTNSLDLLKNQEAFNTFKEIKQKIQGLLEEKHLDLEIVKSIMDDNLGNNVSSIQINQETNTISISDGQQKSQEIQTQSQDEKDITVNVADLRSKISEQEPKQQQSSNNENQKDFLNQLENQFQNITTKSLDVISSSDVKDMVAQTAKAKDILNQIVTQVKIAIEDDQTTMSIQLKPENLGKVAFSLRSQDGVLTGHFVAENNAVKEVIEMNLSNLKQTLTEQGIKFDEVKVVVGNTNQFFDKDDQSRPFNQFSKNKRRRSTSNQALEGIGQKITDIRETMDAQEFENDEHMVDFSA